LGPENCLLVVNGASPQSRQVANVYAHLRRIHPRNVVILSDVPGGPQCTAAVFTEKILQPIFQVISQRNLDSQIQCIIYSTDFPTQINFQAWAKDLDPPLEAHQRPIGSLTGMTYLYRWTVSETPMVVGFETNHYARRGPQAVLDFPLSFPEGRQQFEAARQLYLDGKWVEAFEAFGKLLDQQPHQCGLAYWRFRCQAKAGDSQAAIEALLDAIRRGWKFKSFTEQDNEVAEVTRQPPFRAAMKAIDEPFWEFAPPLPFSAQVSWSISGFPEMAENSPHQYLLSCCLGVTGDDSKGNTVPEILSYLQRSAATDQRPSKGKFLFTGTSDVRSQTRLPNVPAAIRALQALGFPAEVVSERVPKNERAVLGVTMGTARFDWAQSGSQLQPGAIGDNLTSFGGRFHANHNQTTLAEFLRHGAAGGSGTVVEPYSIQNKFPYPLLHAYYGRGFSLAESFFMSVNGPYQLLIVGDALCQPFAKPPLVEVRIPNQEGQVQGVVPITLVLKDDSAAAQRFDLYLDGQRVGSVPEAGTIRIDTTAHADGHHELRFVPVAADVTQASSRVIVPLQFSNHGQQCQLAARLEGASIQIRMQAEGAESLRLYAQGELLEQRDGDRWEGTVELDRVGGGPVGFQAVAVMGESEVNSPPQMVMVPLL